MTSTPFWNLTPRTTLGNWFSPFRRRHVFAAAETSLNTMSVAVLGDRDPYVRARSDDAPWRTRSRSGSMCAGDPSARRENRRRRAGPRDPSAGDRLVVLGAVFAGEPVDRG